MHGSGGRAARRAEAPWKDRVSCILAVNSLFLRDDGLLFGYFETPESFQAALTGMAGTDVNARWQESMAPFFEGLEGRPADESMLELEKVFHLD